MKSLKVILLIVFAVGSFFTVDYALGHEDTTEIGIVAYKTFLPPGHYHYMKNPVDIHALLVIQPGKRTGYYIKVPRDYFYDVDIEDRVPLKKRYGLITGYEYDQSLDM